jgi:ABC-2 type transport system permease protein
MGKYFVVAKMSFQKMAEYRFNFFMRILTNVIWYGITAIFWLSLTDSGMSIYPYTKETLVIYFLLIGALGTIVGFGFQDTATEIRDGKISSDVLRPSSYLLMKLFGTAADKFLMITIVSSILLALNLVGFYEIRLTLWQLIFLIIAVVMAMVGNFLVYFLTALAAFWFKHIYGVPSLVNVASNLISGSMVPIELLPGAIAMVSTLLPFRYFHFFPVQIFLGNYQLIDILHGLTVEGFWILLLWCLYKFLWNKGMKQLEVIGT